MLRAIGSAVGVAVSTAIQYGVMSGSLPADLPVDIRTQVLDGDWTLGQAGSSEWSDGILDAKMKGIHVVFITFLPLMALCLIGLLFVKDKILTGDPKAKQEVKQGENQKVEQEMKGTQMLEATAPNDLESGLMDRDKPEAKTK